MEENIDARFHDFERGIGVFDVIPKHKQPKNK